jgi:hypothetical protein
MRLALNPECSAASEPDRNGSKWSTPYLFVRHGYTQPRLALAWRISPPGMRESECCTIYDSTLLFSMGLSVSGVGGGKQNLNCLEKPNLAFTKAACQDRRPVPQNTKKLTTLQTRTLYGTTDSRRLSSRPSNHWYARAGNARADEGARQCYVLE